MDVPRVREISEDNWTFWSWRLLFRSTQ